MRSGLLLLLLGLPGAALAAEDRYGPSRGPVAAPIAAATAAPAAAAPTTGYSGRLLSWSGKPAAGQPAAPVAAPPRQVAAPVVQPPPPQVFASRGPDPVRLPTSLYDAPAAAPPVARPQPAAAPIAPPQPVAAPPASPAPAAVPPSTVWPQAAAEPVLPPPPAAPLPGSRTYAYSPPRAYSVVREWGGTPDRIPNPPRAETFGGREVALDPNTLGAAQQPDPPEEEVDEERPAAKQPVKGARK